ncbi:MAG: glycosyltransferase family 2 protein [Planctomycetota bacterium]
MREFVKKFDFENQSLRPWSEEWLAFQKEKLGEQICEQIGLYAIPDSMLLSVVIPVYNEENSIRELIDQVLNVAIRKEIVLVDDGSSDRSAQMIEEFVKSHSCDRNEIRFIKHKKNRGKGAAITTGFKSVRGDIVIIQDADLEYDPSEYPSLLKPIIEQKADVVYGSRFLGDHPHRVLDYWHYLGNKFFTTMSNCFTNLNLTDMETCYKVFRRDVIDTIAPQLQQERFGIEPEITARIARHNYRVFELSISYSGRSYAEGKKIGLKDGFNALWCILRYGLSD